MNMIDACPTQPVRTYGAMSGPVPTVVVDGFYAPRSRDFFDAFYDALSAWRLETEHSSSIADKVASLHFHSIVALGDKVIPLIVHELRKRPSFLFLALQQITGENPVPMSARGQPRAMVEAWLLWAERAAANAD